MNIDGIIQLFFEDGEYCVVTGHRPRDDGRGEPIMKKVKVERINSHPYTLYYNVDGKLPPKKIEERVAEMSELPEKPFGFLIGAPGTVKDMITEIPVDFYRILGDERR
jgi:hypothetical protein